MFQIVFPVYSNAGTREGKSARGKTAVALQGVDRKDRWGDRPVPLWGHAHRPVRRRVERVGLGSLEPDPVRSGALCSEPRGPLRGLQRLLVDDHQGVDAADHARGLRSPSPLEEGQEHRDAVRAPPP